MRKDQPLSYGELVAWPRINSEWLPWIPSGELSKHARSKAPSHYESSVVPHIANRPLALPLTTAVEIERATIALSRFDALIPYTKVPLARTFSYAEATASSRIENLASSARRIMEAELDGKAGGNAGLIVSNVHLMEKAANTDIESVDDILAMHRILLHDSAPRIAGTLRDRPVWIGGSDFYPVDAMYVAPHQKHLPALMDDFVAFMHRTDIPVLAHAAIAHAQFEKIHPFADGNGRTGRALVHVLLRRRGLTQNASLPISAGLLSDLDEYFKALDAYGEGDVVPIVRLFAKAAEAAIKRGEWLTDELTSVRQDWAKRITARIDATDWRALDLILQRPVITAATLANELDVTDASARATLNRLESADILVSAQLNRRTRAWRTPEVLEILEEFSSALGRRSCPHP